MKSAISDPKDKLVTVKVVTSLGDTYLFPAMGRKALEMVVRKGDDRIPEGTPTLALINASFSVLSVPFNIIKTIEVDGELWWDSPV